MPAYEEHLKAAYRKFIRRGDFCVDVGVHQGEHLLEMRGLGAVAVGYEPCPDFGADIAGVHRVALSSQAALTRDFYRLGCAGASGLVPVLGHAVVQMYGVEVSTLDREVEKHRLTCPPLCTPPPLRYLKVDVEGHEMDVLEGGHKTIYADQPIISVEYSAATFRAHGRWDTDLWEWAERMDYRIGDLWGNTVKDIAEWRSVVDCSYWDYLLWPSWAGEPEGLTG